MASENLQRQRDEVEKGGITFATGDWPYMRFTDGRTICAFVCIDDMPTIVTAKQDGDMMRVEWWGFFKEQWYGDFMLCDESMVAENVEAMLEKAEDTLMNDLHEPAEAPTEGETP